MMAVFLLLQRLSSLFQRSNREEEPQPPSPFLLDKLPSIILAKVLTKCEPKSYLQLQQTCQKMAAFVQNTPKISVWMNRELGWGLSEQIRNYLHDRQYDGQAYTLAPDKLYIEKKSPYCDCLYGIRFARIMPRLKQGQDATVFMQEMKNHRITARRLTISPIAASTARLPLSTIGLRRMVALLKPEEIELYSCGSRRFEALFQSENLRKVDIHVDPTDVFSTMNGLLPRCQEVTIFVNVRKTDSYNLDEFIQLLAEILQHLDATDLPNLHVFQYYATFSNRLPSVEIFQDKFAEISLSFDFITSTDRRVIVVSLQNGKFELWLGPSKVDIIYRPSLEPRKKKSKFCLCSIS